MRIATLLPLVFLLACKDGGGSGETGTTTGGPANCGDGVVDDDEECDDGNTEDGDGCSSACLFQCASAQTLQYSSPSGDNAIGWDVAADGSGNIVLVGEAGSDAFVAKLDAEGNEVWTATYGGGVAQGVAIAPNGTVLVIGTIGGDLYAVRSYTAEGSESWSVETDPITLAGVATDSQGNVLLTGANDTADLVLQKRDAGGAELWLRDFVGMLGGSDVGVEVVADAQDNVFVVGDELSVKLCMLEGNISQQRDESDIYVAKYNADGDQQWATTFEGEGEEDDRASGIALAPSGGVYITGYTTIDDCNDAGPTAHVLVAHYDDSGSPAWVSTFIPDEDFDPNGRTLRSVDMAANADVLFIVGNDDEDLGFGSWVHKLDPAGNDLGGRSGQGSGEQAGFTAVFPDGEFFLVSGAGSTDGTFNAWAERYRP